jgi:hypothetical protein
VYECGINTQIIAKPSVPIELHIYIWIENSGPKSEARFVLNGNRAGPLSKISTDPRSWVTGLGISHINAKARAGSPKQAECYANILL